MTTRRAQQVALVAALAATLLLLAAQISYRYGMWIGAH